MAMTMTTSSPAIIASSSPRWKLRVSRDCTCHPDEAPRPCQRRYAYSECVKAKKVLTMSTLLIVILVLLLVGALPTWGYSSGWGYGPSGIVGVLVIILIVMLLTGRL